MRVCVTGVNGFVGQHLAAELARHDIEVVGIGMETAAATSLDAYFCADLVVSWPAIGPVDAVIHLAGLAAVGPSFDDPQHYLNVNSSIVTNLGEALIGSSTRIVLVSSGAIYDGTAPLPLAEDSPIAVTSPYAVSKLINEQQAAYYRNRGLDIVIARPFNHIGPGQGPGFLLPDLAQALAAGRRSSGFDTPRTSDTQPPMVDTPRTSDTQPPMVDTPRTSATQPPMVDTPRTSDTQPPMVDTPRTSDTQPPMVECLRGTSKCIETPIKTGNLTTRRDYTDVRDVARAYRLLATQPTLNYEIYNICSGQSRSGQELLDELAKALDLGHVSTETDPARIRPTDPLDIVGDNSRLRDDTGWSPEYPIAQTISDYLSALPPE